jgi:hypothetical protein
MLLITSSSINFLPSFQWKFSLTAFSGCLASMMNVICVLRQLRRVRSINCVCRGLRQGKHFSKYKNLIPKKTPRNSFLHRRHFMTYRKWFLIHKQSFFPSIFCWMRELQSSENINFHNYIQLIVVVVKLSCMRRAHYLLKFIHVNLVSQKSSNQNEKEMKFNLRNAFLGRCRKWSEWVISATHTNYLRYSEATAIVFGWCRVGWVW